jgi:hypothetical protein
MKIYSLCAFAPLRENLSPDMLALTTAKQQEGQCQ